MLRHNVFCKILYHWEGCIAMRALEKVVILLPINLVNDELIVGAYCVPVVLFGCGKVLPAEIALVLHHRLKFGMFCCSVFFQQ